MSRSFTRAKKPQGRSSSDDRKDDTPPPARPVPLPIGGHRRSAPSGGTSSGGPAPISQLRTWQSAQPAGAPRSGPALLGRVRSTQVDASPQQQESESESESESEDTKDTHDSGYNSTPSDGYLTDEEINTRQHAVVSEGYASNEEINARTAGHHEQSEPESEDTKDTHDSGYNSTPSDGYLTDEEINTRQHAVVSEGYASNEEINARTAGHHEQSEPESEDTKDTHDSDHDSTPSDGYLTDEEINTRQHEQSESESEDTKDTHDSDHDSTPSDGYVTDEEINARQHEQSESESEDSKDDRPAPEARQITKQAETAVRQSAAPTPAGRAPKPEKPPLDVPAVRKHRAWLVANLPTAYEGEKGTAHASLLERAQMLADDIALAYRLLCELREIGPGDDRARTRLLSGLGPKHPARLATTYQDSVDALKTRYEYLLEKARREELPVDADGTMGDLGSRVVEYDETDEAQERSAVLVGDQLLWRSDKKTKVHTEASVTHQTGLGAEIFVVGLDNEIHMASHKIGKFHHSSLLGGKPVAMAGEMAVTHGKIDWMSNKSGHYWPTLPQFLQFLHHLAKDEVALDFPVRSMGTEVAFPAGTTAQQFLDGVSSTGEADAKKGHDHVKTQTVLQAWIKEITKPEVKRILGDNGWRMKTVDRELVVTDARGEPVPNEEIRRALKAAHPDLRARSVTDS